MTDEELARLEALVQAATPGPWRAMHDGNSKLADGIGCGQSRVDGLPRPYNPRWIGYRTAETAEARHRTTMLVDADAAFIAAARDAVPALVAEVRRLAKEKEGIRRALARELQENLPKHAECMTQLEAERDALLAENARLRGLLRDVVAMYDASPSVPPSIYWRIKGALAGKEQGDG